MDQQPQLPDSGKPAARFHDSDRWIDLIAFLALLAFGGTLIALAGVPVGSVATACAALGLFYGIWKRSRAASDDDADGDDGPASPAA